MRAEKVEVTRYYSCDGVEFVAEKLCVHYEKELRKKLESEIQEHEIKISKLKVEKNKTRLHFLVDKCDASIFLYEGNMIMHHERMAEYFRGKIEYQKINSDLIGACKELRLLRNKAYTWFGTHKRSSGLAKIERKHKALRWRQENTPDKWRTPNKIRD